LQDDYINSVWSSATGPTG